MSTPPRARPRVPLSELARPTRAYHLRAWAAMAGLAAFVVLYLALAAWFVWTAWRLTLGADAGARVPGSDGSWASARPSSRCSC